MLPIRKSCSVVATYLENTIRRYSCELAETSVVWSLYALQRHEAFKETVGYVHTGQ